MRKARQRTRSKKDEGFEPPGQDLESAEKQAFPQCVQGDGTQMRAQISDPAGQ